MSKTSHFDFGYQNCPLVFPVVVVVVHVDMAGVFDLFLSKLPEIYRIELALIKP